MLVCILVCVCVLQHPGIILAQLVLFMPQMPSGQQVNCHPSRHRTLSIFFFFLSHCQFLNFSSHPSAAFSLASIRPACFKFSVHNSCSSHYIFNNHIQVDSCGTSFTVTYLFFPLNLTQVFFMCVLVFGIFVVVELAFVVKFHYW